MQNKIRLEPDVCFRQVNPHEGGCEGQGSEVAFRGWSTLLMRGLHSCGF